MRNGNEEIRNGNEEMSLWHGSSFVRKPSHYSFTFQILENVY